MNFGKYSGRLKKFEEYSAIVIPSAISKISSSPAVNDHRVGQAIGIVAFTTLIVGACAYCYYRHYRKKE